MVVALVGLALWQNPQSARFDLGERLKWFDVAWMAVDDPIKRAAAIPIVQQAVSEFFSQRSDRASQRLAEARAALLGVPVSIGDAISIRMAPPVIEPGQKANLRVHWSYVPLGARSVRLRFGREYKTLEPGAVLEAEVDVPEPSGSADAAQLRDVGALVQIMVDDQPRSIFASIVKDYSKRIDRLAKSQSPMVAELGVLAQAAIELPPTLEQDPAIVELINLGEALESKQTAPWQVEDWPRVRHGGTVFRAAFPSSACRNPESAPAIDVVIAFPGAGGSENLFFEGYGRGVVVREALKRGWAFLSPAASPTCAKDTMDWLLQQRKAKVRRLYVIGHSMGTSFALDSIGLDIRPSAAAILAPIAVPDDRWKATPLFMGVGKQEMAPLAAIAAKVQALLGIRRDSKSKVYDNCEHLLVVAEAAKDVFSFFDGVGSAR